MRLAETPLCPNQAFSLGKNILGLQFHMEADPNKIESWLVGHSAELNNANIDINKLRQDAKLVSPSLPKAGLAVFWDWIHNLEV